MKIEDCKEGMKVVVTECDENKTIIGMEAVITQVGKMDVLLNLKTTESILCWHDSDMNKCWYVLPSSIEPVVERKISKEYKSRIYKSKYVMEKIRKLSNKYHLPNIPHLVISNNGEVEVYFMKCTGMAKCHPDDKFDINKGLELAFERLAEKLDIMPKYIPKNGEKFYCFDIYHCKSCKSSYIIMNEDFFEDRLSVAIGNCFKTREEAENNKEKIIERYKKLLECAREINGD